MWLNCKTQRDTHFQSPIPSKSTLHRSKKTFFSQSQYKKTENKWHKHSSSEGKDVSKRNIDQYKKTHFKVNLTEFGKEVPLKKINIARSQNKHSKNK